MRHEAESTPLTRGSHSTPEYWISIRSQAEQDQSQTAERVLHLLRMLSEIKVGFAVDQLVHSLQTATRAERDNADPELVLGALCHDIGKAISPTNHPAIAAEILRPYVRLQVCEVVRVHQDFQGRHYYAHTGKSPDAFETHRAYLDAETFNLAKRFADEWDQVAFDPDYDTLPLGHFEPLVRRIFSPMLVPGGDPLAAR